MRRVRWAYSARRDFIRITDRYAAVAPDFPPRLLVKVEAIAKALLDWPDMGAPVRHSPHRKMLVHGTRYLIFYQPSPDGIEIIRVRHRAENWRDP